MTRKLTGFDEQLRAVTREQTMVAVADGQMEAYRAVTGEGNGPGVIVVTHVFGIDQDMKDVCDELAARGCVALAPNFFWRDQDSGVLAEATDVQRAIGRAMRIDFSRSMDELRRGIEALRSHPNCNGKVVLLGYCFGGPYAWRAACDGLGVDASVSFHGTYVSKYLKPGDKPNCPVEFHYGEHDHLAPAEELAAVKAVADANGCPFVLHPGAGHAYMMPANSHYHAEAASKSWDAALQLIKTLQA
nr:dienelactone hydrolase family protein [uncultured Albidiferax sp.]